jgi:hypothetical protein
VQVEEQKQCLSGQDAQVVPQMFQLSQEHVQPCQATVLAFQNNIITDNGNENISCN